MAVYHRLGIANRQTAAARGDVRHCDRARRLGSTGAGEHLKVRIKFPPPTPKSEASPLNGSSSVNAAQSCRTNVPSMSDN
jgi:hypothetical protein